VALKLDFEKAFDKVDHSFILSVLQAKGFAPLWCNWIKQILESATSSVLLNEFQALLSPAGEGSDRGIHFHPCYFSLLLRSCNLLLMMQ
jgi:hypothetical protein